MKKQRSLLIILIILFVILAGAYLLYGNLSENYMPDSLLAVPGSDVQSGNAETDTFVPETTDESAESEAPDPQESNADENNSDENAAQAENDRQTAPDFTVYDADGNAYKLSDFFGKPIILNFWASWCGPCKSEMPEFDAAYKEQGDDYHFVIVNLTDGARETVESAKAYIDKEGYSFPIYYDTGIDAARQYAVGSIPATYFIDKDGYLTAYGVGALDAATLEKGMGMIMPKE